MVKNWMILGDEAFDSESKAVGVIRLAPDEMDDWQSVAWSRFADVVNNNPIVRKMVFGCNYLYVGGSFSRKAGVSFPIYTILRFILEKCWIIWSSVEPTLIMTPQMTQTGCISYLTYMILRKKRLAVFQRRCAW